MSQFDIVCNDLINQTNKQQPGNHRRQEGTSFKVCGVNEYTYIVQ